MCKTSSVPGHVANAVLRAGLSMSGAEAWLQMSTPHNSHAHIWNPLPADAFRVVLDAMKSGAIGQFRADRLIFRRHDDGRACFRDTADDAFEVELFDDCAALWASKLEGDLT